MPVPLVLRFGSAAIAIGQRSTLITLANGTTIPGAPEDTAEYRATALAHGYGNDVMQLCVDHELLHLAFSHWLGIESPTLQRLASGDETLSRLNGLEEDAILAIQRFVRARGIDLTKRFAT